MVYTNDITFMLQLFGCIYKAHTMYIPCISNIFNVHILCISKFQSFPNQVAGSEVSDMPCGCPQSFEGVEAPEGCENVA